MIRKATADDHKEIHRICENDLGYECDMEIVRNSLSKLDSERECVFVAVIDGRVAGFIHIERYQVLYAPAMANILGIAVAKEFRRQGIGRALLSAAEEWARNMGLSYMRLNSGITRKDAHKFYRDLGYGSEKEQLRFIKPLK